MIDTTNLFDGTFSAAGVPSGSAITASRVSTNTLDLLTAVDMGVANPLIIRVSVMTTFLTLTSLVIQLQVCDTVGGSYLVIESSPTYPVAQLIQGSPVFEYSLPRNQLLNAVAGVKKLPGRYLQLNYVVAGSNATAGSVMAWMAPAADRPSSVGIYPSNYSATVAAGEI